MSSPNQEIFSFRESITDQTQAIFEDLLHEFGSPTEIYNQLGAQNLRSIIKESSEDLAVCLETAPKYLDTSPGYILLKDTNLDKMPAQVSELGSIALSCFFGIPKPASPTRPDLAWPIRFDQIEKGNKTFSQTMDEAQMHTDSQYSNRPEQYFGLFCLKADEKGMGTSQLVDGEVVKQRLSQPTILSLTQPYPFRVPTVFTEAKLDENPEITWAPIYTDQSIRYRKDTLERALNVPGVKIDVNQHLALELLEKEIEQADRIKHHLLPGEALFVNNHRMLHGRTSFKSKDRLLLRVRMNNEE